MVPCPHCGAENAPDARFCAECGKALPDTHAGSPRVVDVASSGAGASLQGEELQKQQKKAFTALIIVAVLTTLGAILIGFVVANVDQTDPQLSEMFQIGHVLTATYGIIAAIFWGLAIWSRRNPLPAAIIGLVLYGTLFLLGMIMNPAQAVNPCSWIIPLLIMAMLVSAIQAGLKYRRLLAGQPA